MAHRRTLAPAATERRDGSLWSVDHGDRYHSRSGAAAESRHVFIGASDLARRSASCGGRLTVAELGFGAGLNFALAWREWSEHAPPGALLHYLAWERRPLEADQIAAILAAEGLGKEGEAIAAALPPRWPGRHRIWLGRGVCLTLVYEDAQSIAKEDFAADVWFLDGFSPKANPEMWSPQLMEHVGRLTAPGGVACTYSSAGSVREALGGAGFEVVKAPGYGSKREMAIARLPGARPAPPAASGQVGIVGAGVAAGALRLAFSRRGISPTLIAPAGDRGIASTNPAVLITPRPAPERRALSEVATACFPYARRELGGLCEAGGALLLAHGERERKRQRRIAGQEWPADLCSVLDGREASEHAGVGLGMGGLLLPLALRADGARITAALLGRAERIDASATALRPAGEGRWLLDAGGIGHEFDMLVLACADALAGLAPDGLDLRVHAGKVDSYPATEASRRLRLPLLFGGSMLPAVGGEHLCVAARTLPPAVREMLGDSAGRAAWSGQRVKMRDHLPLAGLLGDGLGALGALGARGFSQAPLLAEHVVGGLLGEPSPLDADNAAAVAPPHMRRQW